MTIHSMRAQATLTETGAVKVNSIDDLVGSGINVREIVVEKFAFDLVRKSKTIFVNRDYVILTPNYSDLDYRGVRHYLNSTLSVKSKTLVCDEEVIASIRSGCAALGDIYSQKEDQAAGLLTAGEESDQQRAFYKIVNDAIAQGCSDIRIIIAERGRDCAVLFKLDGKYREQKSHSTHNQDSLTRMMRAIVDFEIAKNNGDSNKEFTLTSPSDVQIPFEAKHFGLIQLRLGIMPSKKGSASISLRIPRINQSNSLPDLRALGFLEEQAALIEDEMKRPFGAIFFTGPTGSGKTTAIASAICLLPPESPVITLEDPIEINIPRTSVIQCSINEEDPELSWAPMLRQTLRQDPDAILIGEIRDASVAATAARAASTGHLVLTTLHVNDIFDIPGALEHYGLSVHKIVEESFIRLLVAMRIVKKLCGSCKVPLSTLTPKTRDLRRLQSHFKDCSVFVHNPAGCNECNSSGVKGRTIIAEVARLDRQSREHIFNQQSAKWRDHLLRHGWVDMRRHAELLVKMGIVCPLMVEGSISQPFGEVGLDEAFSYDTYRELLKGRPQGGDRE